jgi:hypothetical protein
MNRKVVVSFGNKAREDYNKALLGLIKSCKPHWDGEYFIRSQDGYVDEYLGVKIHLGEFPKTEKYGVCWPHASVPYQFKPFMIQEAVDRGFDVVVWLDSTMRMESDITPMIELAKERGIVAWHNVGHETKHYISDIAMDRLAITEKDLDSIPQIMACGLILDFSHPTCRTVFNSWIDLSTNGVSFQNYGSTTRPDFKAHRHDQVNLSVLLWRYGIPLEPYGGLCYPPHHETKEYGESVFLCNKGVN